MHINANLSADERERIAYINGDTNTAGLLAAQAAIEELGGPLDYIKEARGFVPPEDWMQDEIDELRTLALSMRGDKRVALGDILRRIEDKRDEQARASEYGMEQLDKAAEAIEALR
jgi:ABC-type sugar transport system substrate-binding protein